MARFYFHLRDGDKLVLDPEGTDLPDLDAAKREALLAARDILSDAIKAGKPKVPDAFVIAEEVGRKLAIVPLAAVLPEPLKK
jgi:1-acyl-sn-glycerol-3-phosphate acyltransferase